VPVVELAQGAEVTVGQGLEEGLVVGGDERCHTSTVDLRCSNGSPIASRKGDPMRAAGPLVGKVLTGTVRRVTM